ncbi:MAG: FAD-dependent oxidoreductase [Paracoccaceae bacterium]|nr:FAD-dependent oxidoreductase [Paracoccaceae bacterium]
MNRRVSNDGTGKRSTARVVVIGGGIVGCSVLYHLARLGWTDIVLLEREELTSGSSWHAAGGLFSVTQPILAAEMHRYAFHVYRELEEDFGQPCGFHLTGGLNICRTHHEIESNARMQSACRRLGIEGHFISLDEAKERAPVLDTSHMIGAFWEELGGHVDPASATLALAAAAQELGASIRRHTPVTGMRQRPDGGWLVETQDGSFLAEYVVNAAGLWGREVARLAGVELPLMPVEHQYLVTEEIPLIRELGFELPQINDNENGSYARQEGMGMLLGAYEDTATHWAKNGTAANFGHELLPDDLSRMEKNIRKSVELIPCLNDAGVKRVINGPMIFSPDLSPLIGPHPALANYYCANGVMAGFNQGAGIGRVLSEWIIHGEPEFDVFAWDVARFGTWADRKYTEATTRFFYERRSERIYPYQEFEAGRPVSKPEIHDRLAKAGGVFGASFGEEHPNWFASSPGVRDSLTYRQPNWWAQVAHEGMTIRNAVGLMEFSAIAKFEVSGPNARCWLDYVLANRMPVPGRMTLSPMLSEKGRMIGDVSVACLAGDRFMLFGADNMQLSFMRHFRRFTPRDGVSIRNLSRELAGLHICGPNSRALIARLAERDMSTSSFRFMCAETLTVAGIEDVLTLRVSFTGECGYEMYLRRDRQGALFDALRSAGTGLDLELAGTRSLMHTRLEKSFPAWGLELSSDYTALDCGMMTHVRPGKGEFVGRGAVLEYGPRKERLATLVVDAGEGVVWGDEAIFLDREPVGYVTSGGWGPQVKQHIALGYLLPEAYQERGNYSVEILGKRHAARLCMQPIYDPEEARMRA